MQNLHTIRGDLNAKKDADQLQELSEQGTVEPDSTVNGRGERGANDDNFFTA
jgi:hypothetical protein